MWLCHEATTIANDCTKISCSLTLSGPKEVAADTQWGLIGVQRHVDVHGQPCYGWMSGANSLIWMEVRGQHDLDASHSCLLKHFFKLDVHLQYFGQTVPRPPPCSPAHHLCSATAFIIMLSKRCKDAMKTIVTSNNAKTQYEHFVNHDRLRLSARNMVMMTSKFYKIM